MLDSKALMNFNKFNTLFESMDMLLLLLRLFRSIPSAVLVNYEYFSSFEFHFKCFTIDNAPDRNVATASGAGTADAACLVVAATFLDNMRCDTINGFMLLLHIDILIAS